MKNLIFTLSLILNVYLCLKYLGQEDTVVSTKEMTATTATTNFTQVEDKVTIKKASVKKEAPKEIVSASASTSSEETYEEEEVSSAQIKFDDLQKDFSNKFQKFTYEDLRLSESQVLFYNDLKNERQKELEEYLSPKWEEMRNKGEPTEYYVYTSEDLIFLGKLNDRYLTELRRDWGSDAFDRYQKFLSDYNNDQIHNGRDVKFMIDF